MNIIKDNFLVETDLMPRKANKAGRSSDHMSKSETIHMYFSTKFLRPRQLQIHVLGSSLSCTAGGYLVILQHGLGEKEIFWNPEFLIIRQTMLGTLVKSSEHQFPFCKRRINDIYFFACLYVSLM